MPDVNSAIEQMWYWALSGIACHVVMDFVELGIIWELCVTAYHIVLDIE